MTPAGKVAHDADPMWMRCRCVVRRRRVRGCKKETETMKLNKLKQLFAEERAVSPVVGVALLIAITVILAAVIGGVVLGIGPSGVDAPQAQLSADLNSTDDKANISHNGGEALAAGEVVIKVGEDEYVPENDFTAGDRIDLTSTDDVTNESDTPDEPVSLDGGETVTVVWQDPNSNSESVIAEFEE